MCVYVPLQGGYNRSALHIASIKGLESAVAKLLSLGADAALKDEVRACSHRNTCMCSVHVFIFHADMSRLYVKHVIRVCVCVCVDTPTQRNSEPQTLNPEPEFLNPKPETLNPKLETLNPKP
jgi:hypothetical protein